MRATLPVVVAVLALWAAACKKETPPTPPAPAETKPAEVKPPPPPARQDFPAAQSTLSVMEPKEGRCEWAKLDPVQGKRFLIASFEGDCLGAKTALSRDQQRGAVRFDPRALAGNSLGSPSLADQAQPASGERKDRLYQVDVVAGNAKEIPKPAVGELVELGFDSKGRLLALTLQRPSDEELQAGVVRIESVEVNLGEAGGEGSPAVAHAFSFEGGAWKRVETKPTTEGSDLSPEVKELEASQHLGYTSPSHLDGRIQGDKEDRDEMLDTLYAWAPRLGEMDGAWIRLGVGEETLAVWEIEAEFPLTTGLVAFTTQREPTRPGQWPFGKNDILALRVKGPFLLATQDYVGGYPRLYRGKEHLWGSDTARAVTFWP